MLTFMAGVIIGAVGYRYLGRTNPVALDFIVAKANTLWSWLQTKFGKK